MTLLQRAKNYFLHALTSVHYMEMKIYFISFFFSGACALGGGAKVNIFGDHNLVHVRYAARNSNLDLATPPPVQWRPTGRGNWWQ